MTTAKRRTGNSATFVADSNHHYTPLEQQPIQQQQLQHQQQQEHQNHQVITQQQQQYSNHHHHHQHNSNQNQHENQRLLPPEPSSSLLSSTTVSSSSPLLLSSSSSSQHYRHLSATTTTTQRHPHHHHHYTNYNSTACTRLSQSSPLAANTTAATTNSGSNSSASASSSSSSSSAAASIMRGECSVKLPLDILWLPKSAMRPVGPDTSHTDCILVVGVSRPKLAVVFLTVMLISLFLTFHVLYDSAVYNIQAAQAVHEHHHHHQRLALISSNSIGSNGNGNGIAIGNGIGVSGNTGSFNNLFNTNRANHMPADYGIAGGGGVGSAGGNGNSKHGSDISSSNQQISHPMVFPSNRVHFPKTSRRLPQALIIGIRKCGTRALLEMLYLHPRIQKAGGEVHFFDRDENYMKGLEWYRKKMPHSFRGQITIEKSPSYFVSPEVPERVRAMNASIKLLLIVREPVTRAISDYTQLRSHAATATLPLAAVEQQSATSSAAAAAASPSSLLSAKMSSSSAHSMLYNKLNAGFSSSQQYDNSLGGGGGGSGNGGGGAIGTAGTAGRIINSNSIYGPGGASVGAVKTNVKNPYNSHRQYETTTTASPQTNMASSTAQILSKSFEELAIFPNGTVNESYRPLSISMYHLHLHRWLEVFPREQILIVNGDRLIDDPVSQLKKIETFLGIEHRITGNHFYFNETKGFYCLRYDSGDRCLRETKGRKHPHVDPLVISKLRKFFAEHNQRFYELVGEDLGWPEE